MTHTRTVLLLLMMTLCQFRSISLSGQNPVVDSLTAVLNETPSPGERLPVLFELVVHLTAIDREKARQHVEEALTIARRSDDQEAIAQAHYHLAHIELDNGFRDKALDRNHQARSIARSAEADSLLARIYLMYSSIYEEYNQPGKSLSAIDTALAIAESLDLPRLQGECYHALARVNNILGDLPPAKEYLEKAIAIFEPIGDIRKLASLYQGLSVVTTGEESGAYAQKSYEYFRQVGDLEGMAYAKSTMGAIAYEMDDLEGAIPHFREAIGLFERVDIPVGVSYTELNLGSTYLELERYEEAEIHLRRSKEIASQYGFDDIVQLVYEGLTVVYTARGDARMVGAMIDSMKIIRDTLYNREKTQLLVEANTKFATKEKEAQIAQQELELERQARLRNGIILGSIIILLALTALFQYVRRRQQQQRQQAEMALQVEKAEAEKLRELDELKSAFFANISHEFRTPLSLILGPVQQAKEQVPASEDLAEAGDIPVPAAHLQLIERNAVRLQSLIDQLLDLSKLDSGKMQLKVARGNVIAFLRSMVFSFESLAERNHIHFQTTFPEEVPEAYFDAGKLEKIVVNLLSNAFKFTPEHGTIRVAVSTFEEQIHIRISDSGPGIPPGEQSRIFDRFYQLEAHVDQGTGIGLALVKELVELHYGKITLESTPGSGATFLLTLPVSRSYFSEEEVLSGIPGSQPPRSVSLPMHEQIPPTPVNDQKQADRPLALVVEDNADLRNYMVEVLHDHYRVHTASDGADGLEKAMQLIPDVIVSDIMMPRLNGMELCTRLKEDERTSHVPLILLTARAAQGNKIEGLQTGADDYLTKPFDARELRVRMENLIEQRAKLRAKYEGSLSLRPSQVAVTSVDERFLQQVIEQIETNLGNEFFTVEELARAVNFSRSQLNRKLKALTNSSPNELIRDFRLKRAKDLLEQGAGNVSEVAFQVGYSNLSYFGRTFKQAFEIKPSEVEVVR